jgi:hypothetical protein
VAFAKDNSFPSNTNCLSLSSATNAMYLQLPSGNAQANDGKIMSTDGNTWYTPEKLVSVANQLLVPTFQTVKAAVVNTATETRSFNRDTCFVMLKVNL